MPINENKTELLITEGGMWLVRRSSQTVCHLDLDRMLLRRDRGPGSPVLPHDGEWVPLVRVNSILRGDTGLIRVGDRHEFLTDPGGLAYDYRCWVPRMCTSIEAAQPDDDD